MSHPYRTQQQNDFTAEELVWFRKPLKEIA